MKMTLQEETERIIEESRQLRQEFREYMREYLEREEAFKRRLYGHSD